MTSPVKRRRKGLFLAAAMPVFLAALTWLGGLVWFTNHIPETVADTETVTDAIVVLTGGSQRIQSGLQLLAAGRAKKLFVSGVYHGTDVSALLRLSSQTPDSVQCCIVLGYAADNTQGNALETAQWIHREGFHTLRLVTAAFHMPRSLLEFRRVMPDIRIVENPVFPELIKQDHWWAWPGTSGLILLEYHKYLLALIRPLALGSSAGEAI